MAQTVETTQRAVYELEGTLLEVCSCGVLCPCWIGEDPDGGECYGIVAYHFDAGQVDGVDVAGLSVVNLNYLPGNVLTPGSWRVVMLVDEHATPEQQRALVGAFGGEHGGPLADLADLAGLVGELVAVERAPITHEIRGGKGSCGPAGSWRPSWFPTSAPTGDHHHPARQHLLHRARLPGLRRQGDPQPRQPAQVRADLEVRGA